MSVFTIEGVEDQREYQNREGKPMIAYGVRFSGEQGRGLADLSKTPTTPPPQEGESIDAELIQSGNPNHRPKLKKLWKGNTSSSPAAPIDPATKEEWEAKERLRQAEIRRQSAQKQALYLLDLEIKMGTDFADSKASELLKPRVDWFDRDIQEAGEAA